MSIRFFGIVLFAVVLAIGVGRSASAQQNAAADRFALVIGNAKYPDSDSPPKDAVKEARDVAKELRRDGFDVDIGENLTKEAMRSALDRLYGKIKSGSVALIFFSGYGIQSNRQSYMIPVDAQIWTEPDVRRDGFSIDAMLNQMDIRGAKVKIAILNASRRNPYERRFRSVAAGLAPVIAPSNTLVMYSAAPGTVIGDATAQQGLFVAQLVKELRDPALTGEEVFTHTRLNVTRLSRSEQTPWFSSSLAEEFYFHQAGKTSPVVETTPPETPVTSEPPKKVESTVADDTRAAERRDYDHAKRVGTRKAWDDFLDKHPTGHYALLAEDQLAKLEPEKTPVKTPPPVVEKPSVETPPARKKLSTDEQIRDLDARLKDNPSDMDAHYKRGLLYARNGDYARAIGDLNDVIGSRPNDAQALNNRCWARAMLDELQTALKDCDEALRIRPRFAEALDSRGLVKLKIGLPRNAIVDYDASLRINAQQASSLYGRGIAKLRSGNISGGNSDIAAAKSIDPRIAEEFSNYGIR